jgi:uncharacterized protein YjbJ (UPF0337 family)
VTNGRIKDAGNESFITIRYRGNSMNKDQVKGRIEQAKGQVKQVVGKAFGNKELEQKGRIQTDSGKVQAGYGKLKQDIKDSL